MDNQTLDQKSSEKYTVIVEGTSMPNTKIPTLAELNQSEVERLIPTIVYLFFISAVGITGNSLVIHIYRTKYKFSNMQCFVLTLSVFDLFSCCVAIPIEIATILEQYTFENIWVCKLARCFNTLSANASSFMLLFIAIDRFRKVCKPFGWQIKATVAKFLCILSAFIGILVSLPAIFVYGKHTFDIPEFNLTGSECSTADIMKHTSLPFLYSLVFGVFFLAGLLTLPVLYCLIGQKLRYQARAMNNTIRRFVRKTHDPSQSRARKTSFIMFLITFAFILSFLPHLIFLIIRQVKSDFIDDLSDRDRAVYKFFLRSYFLNSAINPILYSIFDPRFKSACKEMLVSHRNQPSICEHVTTTI